MAIETPQIDLHFEPIVSPSPRALTTGQIQRYNDNGFILPFSIYDAEGVEANRLFFDDMLAKIQAADSKRDAYSINGYHVKSRGIWDIVMNPRILDLIEDIAGPNFVCWGTHFFCKLPHDPKSVPWHQDASYWPFDKAQTVTVWLAIDDADLANGCMQVIPGTHKMGALPWEETRQNAVLNQEIAGAEKLGQPVPFEIKAGSISLHADMLAHGSEPNTSDRRRCGLTMRYCPVSVRNTAGWNNQSIICRGVDPSGHWAHHDRPSGEDLSPLPWQFNSG